jgi:hypothetical protein
MDDYEPTVMKTGVSAQETVQNRPEPAPSREKERRVKGKTTATSSPPGDGYVGGTSVRRRVRWILWAELMKRTLNIEVLSCPKCHGRMRVISAILQAVVVAKILRCLEKKNIEAPIKRPARPPPAKSDPTTTELVEIDWS